MTKEEWIEQEARAARERYWNADNWDWASEARKQLWRSVVAPYYPEPVRVPVDVEGLAEAMRIAYSDYLNCNSSPDAFDLAPFMAEATAALAYLNIEPQPVSVDVEGLADAIRCAEGHFWTWKDISESSKRGYRKCARAALAYLNIEPCAKPEYDPDDVTLTPNERNELHNLRAECERLRAQQPETRPVKVRFDAGTDIVLGNKIHCELARTDFDYLETAKQVMALAAANAVIDVPPGMPSVEELAKMAEHTWLNGNGDNAERYRRMIVAIRDAILAAMPQPREWGEEDVEELAEPAPLTWPSIRMKGRGAHNSIFAFEPWECGKGSKATLSMRHPDCPGGSHKEMLSDLEPQECFKLAQAMLKYAENFGYRLPQQKLGIQPREWSDEDVEELAEVIYEAPTLIGMGWKWNKASIWERGIKRKEARAALAWFDGKRGG